MKKYIKYNPICNPEGDIVALDGEFNTVDLEALKDAKLSLETLICLLSEKQSVLIIGANRGYETRASLDRLKIDLTKNRELLNHLNELLK